ncbi:MAG: hypothetical protein Q4C71_04620 [Microbacteriaceae bacterium]|nr:hypothetical protein [Microbacteriaceae bacterium]
MSESKALEGKLFGPHILNVDSIGNAIITDAEYAELYLTDEEYQDILEILDGKVSIERM